MNDQQSPDFISAFDDIAREGEGPVSHSVGQFNYLNVSATRDYVQGRKLILSKAKVERSAIESSDTRLADLANV